MKLHLYGAIAIALLLSGCGSRVAVAPMSKNVQTELSSIDTTLIIRQSNLDVTVPQTNGSQGGLIGVLVAAVIDSARRSSAENEAAPIVERIQDYNFRQVMQDEASSTLGGLENVRANLPVNLDTVGSALTFRIAYDKSTANAFLLCNIGYVLNSGNLIVTLHASMYPKADTLKKYRTAPDESNPLADGNAIYNNKFSFVKEGITANNIQASLNEAAKNLAKQLATDIDYGV